MTKSCGACGLKVVVASMNTNMYPNGNLDMDAHDWRNQLFPDVRPRITNRILETMQKCTPISDPDDLVLLKKSAEIFEEKMFTAATSQKDYLQSISMKMLEVEKRFGRLLLPNSLSANATRVNQNHINHDWRNQTSSASRQRLTDKIVETLRKCVPVYGPAGLVALKNFAVRLEETMYTAATSQTDYLRRLSVIMLKLENTSWPCSPGTSSSTSRAY
ncbi:hypothetical protein H6P81_004798 [Aristolochia fimbriata]|uniref:Mediator complex subunit 15 KIX domain-containing protein n=1 Tax=Aristolochia fimbriata TaxID=158543 RepID=A0AAV7ETL5_ARIFI|nr:hypothetical protein H6P81_004798 [Aristolochia fimbriata]